MKNPYHITSKELISYLREAEQNLLNSEKIKFSKTNIWRQTNVPNFPGVYALYEGKDKLLYIGETGNLRDRMNDICRTVNHTFRKQLGSKRFGALKSKSKFDLDIESQLDLFFDESLHTSFLRVNFGRVEIETYLVTKYQNILLNSEKKRKLKIELDELED